MKRIAILILVTGLLLTACSQQATPTASDSEMATKVAQILTNMPTATGQGPKGTTATAGLPTVAFAATMSPTQAGSPTVTGTPAPTKAAASPTTPVATATKTPVGVTATPSGPTPTGIAGDPRATLGAPSWTDKMSDSNNWPTGADPSGFTEIAFENGFMELSALKPIDGWRLTFDKLTNAYLEMTVNSGSCLPMDRYGMIARVPSLTDANRGYLFGFTCDGKFSIRKWDGAAKSMSNFIVWKTNAAINAGANKVNRLGVMMNGIKLSIYANGVFLGDVLDSTWLEGNFGIFAGAHESSKYTLKVDEISYWKLP